MIVKEFDLTYEEAEIHMETYTHMNQQSTHPTFIFLHDALGCIEAWKSFPHNLCKSLHFNGIAYDRFGHGKSARVEAERPLDYLAKEAKHILPFIINQLKITKPILVGCSDGASIAMLYGAFDKSCARIISIGGHMKVEDITIEGIRNQLNKLQSEVYLQKLRKLHGNKTEKLIHDWSSVWLNPSFRHWNIKEELKSIRCPTLVIQGQKDEYATAEHCLEIGDAIGPWASTVILDHCGHFPHLEKPSELLTVIRDFLTTRLQD